MDHAFELRALQSFRRLIRARPYEPFFVTAKNAAISQALEAKAP